MSELLLQVFVPRCQQQQHDKEVWLVQQKRQQAVEMARAIVHENKSWLSDFSDDALLASFSQRPPRCYAVLCRAVKLHDILYVISL